MKNLSNKKVKNYKNKKIKKNVFCIPQLEGVIMNFIIYRNKFPAKGLSIEKKGSILEG